MAASIRRRCGVAVAVERRTTAQLAFPAERNGRCPERYFWAVPVGVSRSFDLSPRGARRACSPGAQARAAGSQRLGNSTIRYCQQLRLKVSTGASVFIAARGRFLARPGRYPRAHRPVRSAGSFQREVIGSPLTARWSATPLAVRRREAAGSGVRNSQARPWLAPTRGPALAAPTTSTTVSHRTEHGTFRPSRALPMLAGCFSRTVADK